VNFIGQGLSIGQQKYNIKITLLSFAITAINDVDNYYLNGFANLTL